MMTKTKTIALRAALLTGLLALGVPAAQAAPAATEVRVVNHHGTAVQVYAEDAHGATHLLGRIGGGDFGFLEIGGDLAAKGPVRIKVFPVPPATSLTGQTTGIESETLTIEERQAVEVLLGEDLSQSMIRVIQA